MIPVTVVVNGMCTTGGRLVRPMLSDGQDGLCSFGRSCRDTRGVEL